MRLQHRCLPVNFCKNFKNTVFIEHLRATASELCRCFETDFGYKLLKSYCQSYSILNIIRREVKYGVFSGPYFSRILFCQK